MKLNKLERLTAALTAAALAAGSLASMSLTASAANGAGGYTWEATSGYQTGTTSVTDNNGVTDIAFNIIGGDADAGTAGFCAQDGTGWNWSKYTTLSFTLTNTGNSDVSFALALGAGADWSWYQSTNYAQVGAGDAVNLTYYLQSEEWSLNGDGNPVAIEALDTIHRINMMINPATENASISGSVQISALELGGGSDVVVEPKDGFYVDGYTLRDANGNPFVMRGTNYAYTWFSWDGKTEAALKEIAGYGANAVRIVLGDGVKYTKNTADEIEKLIAYCEKNQLVAIFEVHDATGLDDANSLLTAARYFANDVSSALTGHEDTVLINIANEWQGSANDAAWQSAYIDAVKIIRDAGLKHCIMCDAGGWGQSASTVINGGAAVLAADPEHNCLFSVHMYGTAGGSASVIKNTFDSMMTRSLCLVIGEFGYTHSDGDVDEAYIMSYAKETGTGWLAWSWYGNGSPVEYLDMSNANAGGTLSKDWGEVVINGANGWKETSEVCSVFTESKPATSTTTTTTTTSEITTTTTTVSGLITTTTSEITTTEVTTVSTSTSTSASSATTETTTVSATESSEQQDIKPSLLGDADCSGQVEVMDAIMLARVVAEDGTVKITDLGKRNADCDQDGNVGANDLTLLLKHLAGIELLSK